MTAYGNFATDIFEGGDLNNPISDFYFLVA